MIINFYKRSVAKDFKQILQGERQQIKYQLDTEVSKKSVPGKKLKGQYEGLFSLLVGNYRAVYTFIRDGVLVLRIAHKK